MDRQRMERCLAQVAAYRASGQKSEQWALANGVKPRELASWCSHATRWQAILDGVAVAPIKRTRRKVVSGFVAAKLPVPTLGGTVRVELHAGNSRIELHWPLANAAELAVLLREVVR
jgi:hypothetical protein